MPDTIPGGAYLSADGKTWHDADGKPLAKEQIAKAKELHTVRAAQVAAQERQALEVQARNDPIARSLVAVLQPSPGPAPVPPQPESDESPGKKSK